MEILEQLIKEMEEHLDKNGVGVELPVEYYFYGKTLVRGAFLEVCKRRNLIADFTIRGVKFERRPS